MHACNLRTYYTNGNIQLCVANLSIRLEACTETTICQNLNTYVVWDKFKASHRGT